MIRREDGKKNIEVACLSSRSYRLVLTLLSRLTWGITIPKQKFSLWYFKFKYSPAQTSQNISKISLDFTTDLWRQFQSVNGADLLKNDLKNTWLQYKTKRALISDYRK